MSWQRGVFCVASWTRFPTNNDMRQISTSKISRPMILSPRRVYKRCKIKIKIKIHSPQINNRAFRVVSCGCGTTKYITQKDESYIAAAACTFVCPHVDDRRPYVEHICPMCIGEGDDILAVQSQYVYITRNKADSASLSSMMVTVITAHTRHQGEQKVASSVVFRHFT
jgi:hypothetical protein